MKQYPTPAVLSLFFSAIALTSCTDHGHPRIAFASTAQMEESASAMLATPPTTPHLTDARVILVTIDGVRAEDVFNGADPSLASGAKVDHLTRPEAVMPRLYKLVSSHGIALGAERRGCGFVRTASGANVSLPGYLEIFTGRKTSCRHNNCERVEIPTVLDEAAGAGVAPVASIGSWDMLERAASKGASGVLVADGALKWPGERPLSNAKLEAFVAAGEHVDAFPGVGRYRPDAQTMPIALEYLRTASPRVFHVGLGDSDEWGHRNNYAAYLEAIGKADAFIGQIADTLDTMGDRGARTTVIVTTDHGRNRNFKDHDQYSASAGRTFIMAFGARMAGAGVACASRDMTLADIAPTIRTILGLPTDAGPDAGSAIEQIVRSDDHRVAGGAGGGGASIGMEQRP